MLKKAIKIKFDDPTDTLNKLRRFLITEYALSTAPVIANRSIPTPLQLSEEKRQLAIKALQTPVVRKHLDDIARA